MREVARREPDKDPDDLDADLDRHAAIEHTGEQDGAMFGER